MIKFFRHMRQNLLSEGKNGKPALPAGRYLKYAIGEIVLVVIGILIALQINNQNIFQQERSVERTYLIALKEEFETNKNKLDQTIILNNKIIVGVDKLIGLFEQNVIDTISERTVAHYIFDTFSNEIHYTPSLGVLTEIISSGNLKLIQNQELKQKFASFQSSLNLISHQENEVNIPRLKMMEHFRDHANYKRYLKLLGEDFKFESIFENRSNKELFTSLNFFNSLFFYRATSRAANKICYFPIKEDMEKTIALIDSELNKE